MKCCFAPEWHWLIIWNTFERFGEIFVAKVGRQSFNTDKCAHRWIISDTLVHCTPGKLRKQAIASIGVVQPTIATECLNMNYICTSL
jgi:hypothetical protein